MATFKSCPKQLPAGKTIASKNDKIFKNIVAWMYIQLNLKTFLRPTSI